MPPQNPLKEKDNSLDVSEAIMSSSVSTPEEVSKILDELESKYRMGEQYAQSTLTTECDLALKLYNIHGRGNFAAKDLEDITNEPAKEICNVYYQGTMSGLFKEYNNEIRCHNIMHYNYLANQVVRALHRMKLIREEAGKVVPLESANFPPIPGLALFAPIEEEDLNNFQKLLVFLLNVAWDSQYRKYNGDCYKKKYIEGQPQYYTYAWERVCSLKEFVYKCACKEKYPEIWKHLTNKSSNATSAAEYLANCNDYQLPDLVKDRCAFSFKNGVYLAKKDMFWKYGASPKLPEGIVACKYFDLDFDTCDYDDWYAIPTPHIQSVMDYQGWPEDVCRWMYIFIGRMIYEVGELDGWQVIPFLKGAAGSGKSTIVLKVCANLFEKQDVGILSNNIERKFGLSAFYDKYLFVAPEIKSDLQIEQAEFQSLVSGEDIQINIKNMKAQSIQWKVPGALAGNEVPSWVDNSGSIARRIIVFAFEKMVQNGDMELGQKIEQEMANILRKCNVGYLDAVSKHAKKNIWNCLPPYFKKTRADMEEDTNALEHFLNSPKVTLAAQSYCRYDTFVAAFNAYCIENNFKKIKLTKDNLRIPFYKRNITEATDTRKYPPNKGEPIHGKWVVGVDLASDGYTDDFMSF